LLGGERRIVCRERTAGFILSLLSVTGRAAASHGGPNATAAIEAANREIDAQIGRK
jgi:hypothetical protein